MRRGWWNEPGPALRKVDGTRIWPTIPRMANLILIAAIASTRVGLYPVVLPEGQGALGERLAAQLHEGAANLPGVKAFVLVPRGSCQPDEGDCLASAAKSAGLDQMISTSVAATAHGYRYQLRLFDGARLKEQLQEEVQGGPLDLAAALEHGVCRVLGAAPCLGELSVKSGEDVAGTHLFVDGLDRGPFPIAALQLAVGRHLVRAGTSEQRVRVSYGREVRLRSEARRGGPELLDDAAPVLPPLVLAAAPEPLAGSLVQGRSRAARVLVGAGAALLVASAGAALYSRIEAANLDSRYQRGALVDADASRYSGVRRTGVLATALAATGAGAIAAGGLVLALSPGGVSLLGGF